MECRASELRCKEVIDLSDGTRYGYVGDVALDMDTGKVLALVVAGRLRFLGRTEELVFPLSCVRRVGEDIILVDGSAAKIGP